MENLELPNVLHAAVTAIMGEHNSLRSFGLPQLWAAASGVENGGVATDPTNAGSLPPFPLVASGVMLTADENTAIRCLLEENNVPEAKLLANVAPSFWE